MYPWTGGSPDRGIIDTAADRWGRESQPNTASLPARRGSLHSAVGVAAVSAAGFHGSADDPCWAQALSSPADSAAGRCTRAETVRRGKLTSGRENRVTTVSPVPNYRPGRRISALPQIAHRLPRPPSRDTRSEGPKTAEHRRKINIAIRRGDLGAFLVESRRRADDRVAIEVSCQIPERRSKQIEWEKPRNIVGSLRSVSRSSQGLHQLYFLFVSSHVRNFVRRLTLIIRWRDDRISRTGPSRDRVCGCRGKGVAQAKSREYREWVCVSVSEAR